MKKACLWISVIFFWGVNTQAEEISINSRYISLGLFKNGLAVVKRAVSLPGPGTYRVDDAPEPVHGTFWIESETGVEARMTMQVVEVPAHRNAGTDFQNELAGKYALIHFKDGTIPPASGKVVAFEQTDDRKSGTGGSANDFLYRSAIQSSPAGRFLVLESSTGRIYADVSMIAYLEVKDETGTAKERRPVLFLTAPDLGQKPSEVFYSYLTGGFSWAPAYRVDISDPETLAITQNAVLKNELDDIENGEISLISGFPSVQFANVLSPLSLDTDWDEFFQQLNRRESRGSSLSSIRMNAVAQQAVTSNDAMFRDTSDISADPSGEGVDIHYQPLGVKTLSKGDSLSVETASGTASYERIVEWIIPDTRNATGRIIEDYQRAQDPDKYQDAAWDAIRFRNPLPFPMTTAPAMVVSNGRFNGQRMSYWVNKGEETTLQITKALSLRTYHGEHEETGNREIVYIGGNDYRRVAVKGELRVNNHRNEDISLVIRRRFSGDLTEAEGTPQCVLREEGVYSVNKRNELIWILNLKPGEERMLSYRYSVLVDN